MHKFVARCVGEVTQSTKKHQLSAKTILLRLLKKLLSGNKFLLSREST